MAAGSTPPVTARLWSRGQRTVSRREDAGPGPRESSRRSLVAPLVVALDTRAYALVMATGIVAIAAAEQGFPVLSDALLALAVLTWALVAVATTGRLPTEQGGATVARPHLHTFALVAATAVIGSRLAQAGARPWGLLLWALAVAFWLLLILRRPTLAEARVNSLLVVVATESLAVLAALLAPGWGRWFLGIALAGWLLGLLLYPLVIALIGLAGNGLRHFDPDLWIAMGALAITTLAGSTLLQTMRELHGLTELEDPLHYATLATWGCASVLIGPLLLAELRTRSGWRYQSSRWSFVFPLGMYAAATHALARADALPQLNKLSQPLFIIALAAWTLTFLGLSRRGLAARNHTV